MARQLTPGPLCTALAALIFLFCAAPGWAQTRLYLLFAGDMPLCSPRDCQPPRLLEIDADGRRILADTPVLHARENATWPVVTPDGRYVAWIGTENRMTASSYLSVFETTGRWQSALVRTSVLGYGGPLFAHPVAVRLYSQFDYGSPVTVVEPEGFRGLAMPCASAALRGISGDGTRLVVQCIVTAAFGTVIVDSTTAAIVGQVAVTSSHLVANDEGTELYSAVWTGGSVTTLRRHDVASGAVLAEQAIGVVGAPLVFDARTRRLYVSTSDPGRTGDVLDVYDGDTLALLARLPAPFPYANAAVLTDPDEHRAFVVWYAPAVATNGWRSRIVLYDVASFSVVAQADLANDTRFIGMVMGPRPPRATGLSSTVAENAVTLQWTTLPARASATGLLVEAGSAPGLSNLAVLPVAAGQTTLTVPDVPRGTYYVRVRTVNGTGPGQPSNEVVVSVP